MNVGLLMGGCVLLATSIFSLVWSIWIRRSNTPPMGRWATKPMKIMFGVASGVFGVAGSIMTIVAVTSG